jgi:hypothetical protein
MVFLRLFNSDSPLSRETDDRFQPPAGAWVETKYDCTLADYAQK